MKTFCSTLASYACGCLLSLSRFGVAEHNHVAEGLTIGSEMFQIGNPFKSYLKPVVVGKEQLRLFRASNGSLGNLLSHIASELAGLQLVAEEDHVVGFDHRVDVNLGYSGNDETSPIGFCNVDHVMDLVPISVENPFTISVFPRSHIHNYMGIPVDLCHQVWVDLSIVINPDLLSPGQVSFEHIFLEI